jgi:hypothetical protein
MYGLVHGVFRPLNKRLQTAKVLSLAINGPNNIKYIAISNKAAHIFNRLNADEFKLESGDCYHHFYVMMYMYDIVDEISKFDKNKYEFEPNKCEYCKFEESTKSRPIIDKKIPNTICIKYRSIAALIPVSKFTNVIIKVEKGKLQYNTMIFECENGTYIVTDAASKRYLLNAAMELPCN